MFVLPQQAELTILLPVESLFEKLCTGGLWVFFVWPSNNGACDEIIFAAISEIHIFFFLLMERF